MCFYSFRAFLHHFKFCTLSVRFWAKDLPNPGITWGPGKRAGDHGKIPEELSDGILVLCDSAMLVTFYAFGKITLDFLLRKNSLWVIPCKSHLNMQFIKHCYILRKNVLHHSLIWIYSWSSGQKVRHEVLGQFYLLLGQPTDMPWSGDLVWPRPLQQASRAISLLDVLWKIL